ncbi:hypothetical protein NW801_09455 [Brevibacillus laterosporus]|uniref:Ankyrin repeat domain-containing protein n=1 Tax=Brevibacillus halotolerans TaxID=1507437 RepID=A0ABT4HW52_9BACL|nr:MULTISPECIES: hypothetical protein [Brevibacillus]MCR8985295.1 hypothetical protein [Brevibacillus laterosporus]MCZ0831024.1 hypothetical protein [Brevibacillus halotolerans]GIO00067.1 hypothetical protein J5TS2_07350 [Brevibacillus halotolerans]
MAVVDLDQRMLHAIEARDIKAAQALLDGGMDVNASSNKGTYLDWAWSGFKDYSFDIIKLLIENEIDDLHSLLDHQIAPIDKNNPNYFYCKIL